jgi:hypothetical protein
VARAIAVGDHVFHGRRHDEREWRHLFAKINTQRILVRRATTFLVFRPFVHVVPASNNAEMAGHVGSLGRDRR